jgi:hypothetical protein
MAVPTPSNRRASAGRFTASGRRRVQKMERGRYDRKEMVRFNGNAYMKNKGVLELDSDVRGGWARCQHKPDMKSVLSSREKFQSYEFSDEKGKRRGDADTP